MMYLIPAPAKLENKDGVFTFAYDTHMSLEAGCSGLVARQAALFQESVKKILGYSAMLTRGCGRAGDIVLRQDDSMNKQSYVLDIEEDRIMLVGEESGLWYGMQTLLQILEQCGAEVPALHIEDEPDILNRGYYFDSARGRVPKLSWLKELADRMAYYKLNQLQLYIEHSYLFRDLTELWRDDTPLTAAEIMELDHYCAERGIELVPSLSSFGHLYKLLSTKEYAHLCELEGSEGKPFSVKGRMAHHTINTTDPESLVLIKKMLGEYMELFSSRQFNLCADETFDLGRGRSREAVERLGKDRVYINFVKALAQFLLENGRRPMFWGDIIAGFPEMIRELPAEMICLNWGYAWDQREEETRRMHEAGAVQYCCPGCSSWNQLVPLNWNAYQNIMRMCSYAAKYNAIGVLNTDWGDYLHVCHPDFTRVGMVYGAAFSWNTKIPSFEEINRQISRLEYHDNTERFLEIVSKIQGNVGFEWEIVCIYKEMMSGISEDAAADRKQVENLIGHMEGVDEKNGRLEGIKRDLYAQILCLDSQKRALVKPYIVAIEGIQLLNEAGKVAAASDFGMSFETMPDCRELARRLETWLYHYKEIYREVSRESELGRIQALVCWYGDYLRDHA